MNELSLWGPFLGGLVSAISSVELLAVALVTLTAYVSQGVALGQVNELASACRRTELETSILPCHWVVEGWAPLVQHLLYLAQGSFFHLY